ncbi:CDP-alcohol phosphatidyltransferase family protein [Aureimonas sp. SK2]|uniref:CDP-alcohol phosphatidyltransferase family protein n=1 Tax=Aureimonas sp. SK2 TaxID=3015992 RepID=UPI00244409D1|nr:CDP-alcohol phosphatidyltransferase family protein [Aureimonas sp. SK2]
MRFDPIRMPRGGAPHLSLPRRPMAAALPHACTTLAATALTMTVAASVLVAQAVMAWPLLPLSLALFLPVAGFVVWRIDDHPHDRFGPANIVTAARGGMAALIGASAWEYGALTPADSHLQWALAATVLLALSLDGIDGFLARRTGLASRFGERFDMEVDAYLILMLCALAFASGKAGVFVFAIGLMRYAFVAAAAFDPRLARPLPPSLRRKTVCVLQIALLCLVLLPPVVPPLSQALAALALAALALALLAWSFAVDVRILVRVRA